ncbi:MAG: glycosyltransferase family 2 protein [Defluviimonas sp.]|nr:glycosyltransferase family 2 protein [Defluviimonas sp.]
MTEAPALSIDICLCTFRRPQLAATLRSLQALRRPAGLRRLRVIVADNDTTASARDLVAGFDSPALPVLYIHAPERNISVARNACLDHASADLVAWIDDDETADPAWLLQLLATARQDRRDAVFGPAIARYPDGAPSHMVKGDFHSNRPVRRGGVVQTGHTCNALVDLRNPAFRALRFDLAKGRTGGEDTDYFHRLWALGASLGICETAEVYEEVAPARLRPGWIIRRSFNAGNVFGGMARRGAGAVRVVSLVGLAGLKAGYCFAVAALNVASPTKRLWWARRGVMHVGVAAGLMRVTPKAQY